MRILWENQSIDSRFTGKKFLKAERVRLFKKKNVQDIPNLIDYCELPKAEALGFRGKPVGFVPA